MPLSPLTRPSSDHGSHLYNHVSRHFTSLCPADCSQIEKAIRRYEDTLAARESHPPRSKDDDLRMCRLCFVRKFTDGLGNTCGDCLHRVCSNCSSLVLDGGGGTSPTPRRRFVSQVSARGRRAPPGRAPHPTWSRFMTNLTKDYKKRSQRKNGCTGT